MNYFHSYALNKKIILLFIFVLSNIMVARPLNILMNVVIFPKLSETFVLNQITGLIDRGHNVYIHAKKRGESEPVHAQVYEYNLLSRTSFGQLPEDLSSFDVVICHLGMLGADFVALKDKRGFNGKVITCFRGVDMSKAIKSHPRRYTNLFKKCDFFLPVCDYFRWRAIHLGCDPLKIAVHHSAINCRKFKFRERKPDVDGAIRIITVGRLVEKKGMEYSIRAVARLIKRYPHITYTIIGGGILTISDKAIDGYLQGVIDELGVGDKVKLLGGRPQKEVIQLLDESHIFMLPSVTAQSGDQEGIPNVLKEAMASGLPVVSTYHSGIPELIEDGMSGFLAPERNVDVLADRLAYLIEHSEIWPDMGRAGRKKIEQEFDVKKINDELQDILYRLCE